MLGRTFWPETARRKQFENLVARSAATRLACSELDRLFLSFPGVTTRWFGIRWTLTRAFDACSALGGSCLLVLNEHDVR